uniref:BPI2 domain-containing protein n=1 Tax=Rhabditophanes sp. KR3021 TaxID=114890 RepID=A0AC35TGN5_9BILA
MERLMLPNYESANINVTETLIKKFEKPELNVNFVNREAIELKLKIPEVSLLGDVKANYLGWNYKVSFSIDIRNLEIDMRVKVIKNEITNETYITVHECNLTKNYATVLFHGKDAHHLNSFKGLLNKLIHSEISDAICNLPYNIKSFLEMENKIGMQKREKAVLAASEPTGEEEYYYNTLPEVLCLNYFQGSGLDNVSASNEVAFDLNKNTGIQIEDWGIDFSLKHLDTFLHNDIVFGIDGTILYLGQKPQNVTRSSLFKFDLMRERMLGLVITEYVANTFLQHLYIHQVGTLTEQFLPNDAPRMLRKVLNTFCSTCKLVLNANLTKRATLVISKDGIQLNLSGEFSISFIKRGSSRCALKADIAFLVNAKPMAYNSTIYGGLFLKNVEFKVKEIGVGGFVGRTLKNGLNAIVRKIFWPALEKKIKYLLNQEGIMLPNICGVNLEHLDIKYVDGAVIISSDFTYDIDHLAGAFTQFIDGRVQAKLQQNQNVNDILRNY